MNEFTPFLAAGVVLAHVGVIFWPRKPLPGPVDANGLPDLWRNEGDVRANIACVWHEKSAESIALKSQQPKLNAVVSFSDAAHSLEAPVPQERRSVA